LPNMLVIRNTTLSILKEFSESGGKILVYGRYPEYVDGELDHDAIEGLKSISQAVDENDFTEMINELLPADFKVEGPDNEIIWTHYRLVNDGGILQLSNTSRLK